MVKLTNVLARRLVKEIVSERESRYSGLEFLVEKKASKENT